MNPEHHSPKHRTLSGRKNRSRGRLFILSAPSGAGKTTLRQMVLERFPDMLYSVSYTTRPPRSGEQEGVDYHFIDHTRFQKKMDQNLWAEWALVHDHYYGTCATFLENGLTSGDSILLDVDVQGAFQILDRYPDSVMIFIMPPSLAVLRHRLLSRGTDSPEQIAKRLGNAAKEMAFKDRYHHIIVNDELTQAARDLIAIVEDNYPKS